MNRIFLGLAAALLLGLAGCDDSPKCESFPADLHQTAGMLLAGKPEELRIFADVGHAGDCAGVPDPTINSVYVEIYGPDQQPVAHESSYVTPSTPAALIRFTPAQEGRYHFFVAFDPLGQVQQFDLLAVRDRSTEPPLQTLQNRCNALERTRSGTWLCDTNVFRGPAFVETLLSGRIAVAGDVVWLATGSQLLRYKDIGTELQLTATMVQQLGQAQYVHASEDEAVLLLENWIQRVTFNGTELTATSPTRWERPGNAGPIGDEGPQGILFRTGERLFLVQSVFSVEGLRLQSCPYELIEGHYVRMAQPCQVMEGVAAGFEPSVLWVADKPALGPNLGALRRLELTQVGFIPTATLSVPPTLTLAFPQKFHRSSVLPVLTPNVRTFVPVLRAAVPVYVSGQSQLRLEHLDEGVSSPQASPSFFWGSMSQDSVTSSGTRIRTVTPPP